MEVELEVELEQDLRECFVAFRVWKAANLSTLLKNHEGWKTEDR
jgi:hypothetical protein